jgi:hypothetical protein
MRLCNSEPGVQICGAVLEGSPISGGKLFLFIENVKSSAYQIH